MANTNNVQKTPFNRGVGPGSRFSRTIEKPKDAKKVIKRLIKYLVSSKLIFILLIVSVLFYTFCNLYNNILLKNIVESLGEYDKELGMWVKNPNGDEFIKNLIYLGIFELLFCITMFFNSLLSVFLSTNTVRKMRNDLFNKIVHLPIYYTDSHEHGDILSRMTNDVDNISNAISQSVTTLFSGIITIIGCLGIMIYYSPLLTLGSVVVVILTFVLTLLMNKYARPLFKKQQIILGKLNTQTEEMVSLNKTVMTNNRELIAIEEFNEYSNEFRKTATIAQIVGGSMGPLMNFINNVGYFLTCLLGSLFILKGIGNTLLNEPLTVAIVIMFLTTSKKFARPINNIANLYSSLITALAGAERVFAIMDEKEEDFSGTNEFKMESVVGDIEFDDVVFGYPSGKLVLDGFSMKAKAGSKIALVGATGSGKTTIVNLLLRYYDINGGSIKIDGKDINLASKKELRDSISIVLQDPILFGESIENNIKYGKEDATDEDVDNALTFANCTSFVNKLENGKKTVLTENASNISQGQRQLLTIARAVIANPKILILDEATSSVDTRTEKKIQDAMNKLMENRTSIIIAHRLSTIQDANMIIVLDKGKVVEKGTHKELLELNGVYKNLYETQFKGIQT